MKPKRAEQGAGGNLNAEQDELERLRNDASKLEAQAGIVEEMKRAREGSFFPLGIDGEKVSSEEYHADEHDDFRRHARDAYFSVRNMDLRKKLIAAQRNIERCIDQRHDADVIEAETALQTASAKQGSVPWLVAGFWALVSVALGAWQWGVIGAIGGAVFGYFLGNSIVAEANKKAASEVSEAQETLKRLKNGRAINALYPETFSHHEQYFGERVDDMDRQSAYANILQSEHSK